MPSAQKIKKDLIHKSKIRKEYRKLKQRQEQEDKPEQDATGTVRSGSEEVDAAEDGPTDSQAMSKQIEGADRQSQEVDDDHPRASRTSSMVARASERESAPRAGAEHDAETGARPSAAPVSTTDDQSNIHPSRRSKLIPNAPFARALSQAAQRKREQEARQAAREESMRQRAAALEQRERFRRAMAKARKPGVNGQRRLGRESGILLEKVRRVVGGAG